MPDLQSSKYNENSRLTLCCHAMLTWSPPHPWPITWMSKADVPIRPFSQLSVWTAATPILAIGALVYATDFAVRYIDQPLIDGNAFRQTQTALTAYWLLKGGPLLAYITPVAGFPWAIPF